MGYFFWDAIPRTKDDSTRIAAFVAAELAKQDELSELGDVNIPAPNEGDVLTWESPKWIASAPAVGNGDLSLARYWRTGAYHVSALLTQSAFSGGKTCTINTLVASPYPTPIQMTFDRIGIGIQTAVAEGQLRLGIYNNSNGAPSSLALDAGTINASSTGFKEIIIDQTLAAGLYWLVLNSNNTTIKANAGPVSYYWGSPIGERGLMAIYRGTSESIIWQASHTYNALPASFPSPSCDAYFAPQLLGFIMRRSA